MSARFGEPCHQLLRGRITHVCSRVETQQNIQACVLRTELSHEAYFMKIPFQFLLWLGHLIAASHGESELKIYAPGIFDADWGIAVKHRDKPSLARTIRAIKRLLVNKHTGYPLIHKNGGLPRSLSQLARRCWCPNLDVLYLSRLIVYRGIIVPPHS